MVGHQRADPGGHNNGREQMTGQEPTHGGYDRSAFQPRRNRIGPIGAWRDDEQHRHRPEGHKNTEGHGVTRASS
ncbi:hypothetical protein D3C84_955480 [compost metagenome]